MIFLAQTIVKDIEDVLATKPNASEVQIYWHIAIVLGAGLLVGGIIFLLVYLMKRREVASMGEPDERHSRKASRIEESYTGGFRLFGRRRRKYRQHRPRNPTLAETGGLPPIRSNPSVIPPP